VLLALSVIILLLVAALRRHGGAAQSIAQTKHDLRADSLRQHGEYLALSWLNKYGKRFVLAPDGLPRVISMVTLPDQLSSGLPQPQRLRIAVAAADGGIPYDTLQGPWQTWLPTEWLKQPRPSADALTTDSWWQLPLSGGWADRFPPISPQNVAENLWPSSGVMIDERGPWLLHRIQAQANTAININTAPGELLEMIAETQDGFDLTTLIANREAGIWSNQGIAFPENADANNGNTRQQLATSLTVSDEATTWWVRLDVHSGPVAKAWWLRVEHNEDACRVTARLRLLPQ
jgi:hypothetical protein